MPNFPYAPFEPVKLRLLSWQDYHMTWSGMRDFTERRTRATEDEIWLVQHPPVFTLGLNGKESHVLERGDIPLVHSDRGGQVTYHGPGQLLVYFLVDLQRRGWGVRYFVSSMEQLVIDLLQRYGIQAERRENAPGVYVGEAKIAALGLRVKHGCCYHGLSLNVDMDLKPFSRINPCGFPGLKATQVVDLVAGVTYNRVLRDLKDILIQYFLDQQIYQQAS